MCLVARNIKVVLTGTNHYKTWHIFASPPSWSCDVRKSVLATTFCLPFFAKEVCRILHAETSYQNCNKLGSCLKQRKAQREDKHLAKPASLHITLTNWAPVQLSAYLRSSNMQRPFMWSKGNKLLARCHPDCPIVGWLADVTVFRNLIRFPTHLPLVRKGNSRKRVWIIFPRVERSNE